jgi:hypothetical protein
MTDITIVERGQPEESSYVQLGCEIAQELSRAYPMHPWQVSFQGGAMIVRHEHINAHVATVLKREGFGFLLPKDKLDNHKEVVRTAMLAGGEMLERFGFPRGKWDGERMPEVPKEWKLKQEAGFS